MIISSQRTPSARRRWEHLSGKLRQWLDSSSDLKIHFTRLVLWVSKTYLGLELKNLIVRALMSFHFNVLLKKV